MSKKLNFKKVAVKKLDVNAKRLLNKYLAVLIIAVSVIGAPVAPALADVIGGVNQVVLQPALSLSGSFLEDFAVDGQDVSKTLSMALEKRKLADAAAEAEAKKASVPIATIASTTKASGGGPMSYIGSFKITAYCNCKKCQGPWVNQTATGRPLQVGRTIAVDKKKIPLGSEVMIDGLGWRVADDTGGAIKGNKIDIFVGSHSEALQWGRRTLNVWIR